MHYSSSSLARLLVWEARCMRKRSVGSSALLLVKQRYYQHQVCCLSTSSVTERQRRSLSSVAVDSSDDDDDFIYHEEPDTSGIPNQQPRLQPSQHSNRRLRPLYVAATRQHVGKTTTSLALVSGLQKRVGKIGFIKPVGQQSLRVLETNYDKNQNEQEMVPCDKDAVLVRHHFGLSHLKYSDMSPVLIPPGYTKDYVDGKITLSEQRQKLDRAFAAIQEVSDVVLCEGTGHTAVGSIVDASNAEVASWLGARMVLVANGGLGNALDDLDLNKVYCDKYGVEIAGVIINKVLPHKYEQTRYYLAKALRAKWGDVPLLGVIPDRPFLGCPALADLENLFGNNSNKLILVSGREHLFRHYTVQDINLVATSLEVFLRNIRMHDPSRTLYVSHASRNDILLGFLMEAQARQRQNQSWQAALIVTGCEECPPSQHVLEMLLDSSRKSSSPPVLLAPRDTTEVMEALHRFTPKLNFEDEHRVDTAIQHYEDYIDFDLLLERLEATDESLSESSSTAAAMP